MTDIEAENIAKLYASGLGEILPGFTFGIGSKEEFIDKYYFDFIWLTLDGQIPKEPPVAGGARGFTVNKDDKQVEITSHGEYAYLKNKEGRLNEMHQLLSDFKNGKKSLIEVKARFDLSSEQLLTLSKTIKDTELNREKIYEIIGKLLNAVKN